MSVLTFTCGLSTESNMHMQVWNYLIKMKELVCFVTDSEWQSSRCLAKGRAVKPTTRSCPQEKYSRLENPSLDPCTWLFHALPTLAVLRSAYLPWKTTHWETVVFWAISELKTPISASFLLLKFNNYKTFKPNEMIWTNLYLHNIWQIFNTILYHSDGSFSEDFFMKTDTSLKTNMTA